MAKYEVFISFKNTDEFGRETPDAQMSRELYDILMSKNIMTFFSPVSIRQTGKAKFAQAIDEALEQCNILVAVGTKTEYLESNWVFDEIDTFRNEMLNGNKPLQKSALISYVSSNLTHKELPLVLRKCESFYDVNRLVDFIITKRNQEERFINEQVKTETPTSQSNSDLIAGRFQLLKEIGHGGTSTVYTAYDQKADRTVAVKMFSQSQHPLLKDAFMEEAYYLRKLGHISIPRVFDILETPETLYVVMDYIQGQSLQEYLNQNGPLSEAMTLDIARQLCDTLDYLHSQTTPIIYRDLKPANVILQEDSKIMLIDFGAAREYKEQHFCDTTLLGTVGYAAPEQYGGFGQTDMRTDIYGLGITLYALLTGINPSNPSYIYTPVREKNPAISKGFEYIINKCVEKDPENRYQSIAELRAALDNIDMLSKKRKTKSPFKLRLPLHPKTCPPPVAPPPIPVYTPVATELTKKDVLTKNHTEANTDILSSPTLPEASPFSSELPLTALFDAPEAFRTQSYKKVETLVLKTKGLNILLSEQVFGQDAAIEQFISGYFHCEMLTEFGQNPPPYATFLFMGPASVGKTFLAKSIAHTFRYPYKLFTAENTETLSEEIYSFVEASPKCLLILEGIEYAAPQTIQFLAKMLRSGIVESPNKNTLSLDKTMIVFSGDIDDISAFPKSLLKYITARNIIPFTSLSAEALCNIGKRVLLSGARDFEQKLDIPIDIDERVFMVLLYQSEGIPSSLSIRQAASDFYTYEIFDTLRFGILNSLGESFSELEKICVSIDLSGSSESIHTMFENTSEQTLHNLQQMGKRLTYTTSHEISADHKTAMLVLKNFKLI